MLRSPVITHFLIGCLLLGSGFGGSGCTPSSTPGSNETLELAIDKSNPEQLLRFFFGSYGGPSGGDPFKRGILTERDGKFYLNIDSLTASFPPAERRMLDQDDNRVVDWEELESFLQATYYEVREPPPTLDSLRRELSYRDTTDWYSVGINGVMTTARRYIYVSRGALAGAITGYHSAGERLMYPTGTTIVGEHRQGGRVVEVTAMRKREDGFWDYFVYDSSGGLTASTHTEPKQLSVPAQCAGCHFGSRLFEPEESYPGQARSGPHGPRKIHVDENLRRADIVRYFDEHRKRSDYVLGIYNTLFVAHLLGKRNDGTITAEEKSLLHALNL
jgi:hypothetical protein